MANVTQGGFEVWGTWTGGQGVIPSPRVSPVANNYGTALAVGDIIIPVNDGTVARAAAANNGLLLGVIVGLSKVVNGQRVPTNYVAANTTFTPTTVGSPNETLCEWVPLTGDVILKVQADEGITAATLAAQIALIGENCDMATGTADATTGRSAFALDVSTHVTTTANFRIVGIDGYTTEGLQLVDNDPTASRFSFLVVCNEGFLPPYTATGV